MITVSAHVKDGVVFPDSPLGLPDGAKVQVRIAGRRARTAITPNKVVIAMLQDVAELTKDMPETDGSDTLP